MLMFFYTWCTLCLCDVYVGCTLHVRCMYAVCVMYMWCTLCVRGVRYVLFYFVVNEFLITEDRCIHNVI